MLSFKAEAQQEDQGQEDKNGSEASSSNSTFEYLSLLIGGTTEGQGSQPFHATCMYVMMYGMC